MEKDDLRGENWQGALLLLIDQYVQDIDTFSAKRGICAHYYACMMYAVPVLTDRRIDELWADITGQPNPWQIPLVGERSKICD